MVAHGHLCPLLFPCQAGVQVLSIKRGVPPLHPVILGGSVSSALGCSEVAQQITDLSLLVLPSVSPTPHGGSLQGARCSSFGNVGVH